MEGNGEETQGNAGKWKESVGNGREWLRIPVKTNGLSTFPGGGESREMDGNAGNTKKLRGNAGKRREIEGIGAKWKGMAQNTY